MFPFDLMQSVIRHYATEVSQEHETLPMGGWGSDGPRYMPTGRKFLRWTDINGQQHEEVLYRGHSPREFAIPGRNSPFLVFCQFTTKPKHHD